MNENVDPDTALTKDAPQHITPTDNAKTSLPLRRSTGANSVETSSHDMPSDPSMLSNNSSNPADDMLGDEDIMSMDSLFDIGDAPSDASLDDIAPVNTSDATDLTQGGSDNADELDPVLGKIPVEVTVELGSFIVDAANSSNLSAGDVLTLHTVCPGQVRLMCDNAEVGRGELVDINGQLGVQIVHNWSR